jgi:hypothetical protein
VWLCVREVVSGCVLCEFVYVYMCIVTWLPIHHDPPIPLLLQFVCDHADGIVRILNAYKPSKADPNAKPGSDVDRLLLAQVCVCVCVCVCMCEVVQV